MTTTIKPLEEIKAELDAIRQKKAARENLQGPTRRDWYGLVYMGPDGYCSVSTFEDSEEKIHCLGRSIEIIPYLREHGIDGNDIAAVLNISKKFRAELHETVNRCKNTQVSSGTAKNQHKTNHLVSLHPHNKTQSCRPHNITEIPLKCPSDPQNKGVTMGKRGLRRAR